MAPSVGGRAPEMQLKSVVLPEPLGPMRPRISPSRTSKDTAFSAVKPPNRLVRPVTVSMGTDAGPGARGRPARPISDQPRAAHGEEAGSGRIGGAVDTVFGNTTSNFPSWTWNTTGKARSFWPRMALPSPRNFTP